MTHPFHSFFFLVLTLTPKIYSLSCDSTDTSFCSRALGPLSICIYTSGATWTAPAMGDCSLPDGTQPNATQDEGNSNSSSSNGTTLVNVGLIAGISIALLFVLMILFYRRSISHRISVWMRKRKNQSDPNQSSFIHGNQYNTASAEKEKPVVSPCSRLETLNFISDHGEEQNQQEEKGVCPPIVVHKRTFQELERDAMPLSANQTLFLLPSIMGDFAALDGEDGDITTIQELKISLDENKGDDNGAENGAENTVEAVRVEQESIQEKIVDAQVISQEHEMSQVSRQYHQAMRDHQIVQPQHPADLTSLHPHQIVQPQHPADLTTLHPHLKSNPTCLECTLNITRDMPGFLLTDPPLAGAWFHETCFRCDICECQFSQTCPFVPFNGRAYCEKHYQQQLVS